MTERILGELFLPFLGTSLGAGCVFFLERGMGLTLQRALTGFAAGVMAAASVWSLLIPAMEQAAELGRWAFLPAVIGFWLGVLFLLALDRAIPHLHQSSGQPEGPHTHLKRTTMLVLAIILHNIPEGMAVGVVLAGWLAGDAGITAAGSLALSVGIAVQNFPEGAIISLPLRSSGMGKGRAFLYGVLSGVVDSREYYGLYIKYYIRLAGQTIKVIEKNDGVNIYEAGQAVKVVMDPRDVMAYPAG